MADDAFPKTLRIVDFSAEPVCVPNADYIRTMQDFEKAIDELPWPQKEGPASSRDDTGVTYITIRQNGYAREGDEDVIQMYVLQDAYIRIVEHIERLESAQTGVGSIKWRRRPQLRRVPADIKRFTLIQLVCRLSFS